MHIALKQQVAGAHVSGGDGPHERVETLDMLRGLLALAVAVYHFSIFTHVFSGAARDMVVVAGIYAVQMFFIISGFCFFHLYADAPLRWSTWRSFHIKRFFRIAPLYYLAVACSYWLDPPVYVGFDALKLLENLSLLFGLLHPNHAMVPGGWSIGLEYVFYLALPLLLLVTRYTVLLYALTAALIAWAVPYTFGRVAAEVDWDRFHAYVLIPNQAFLFLLGGIVAHVRRRVSVRLPVVFGVLPLAAFVYAVTQLQAPFIDHLDVMVSMPRVKYVLLCFFTALVFALLKSPRSRAWKPLRVLGDWSYSTYLVHPYAWLMVSKLIPASRDAAHPQIDGGLLRLLCALATTLVISALTYRYLELPANRFGHRLAKRWSSTPTGSLALASDGLAGLASDGLADGGLRRGADARE